MTALLDALRPATDLRSGPRIDPARLHSRRYTCRCGAPIFFRNTVCLNCRSPLGFLPMQGVLTALDPGPRTDTVLAAGQPGIFKTCANREGPPRCNWLLAAQESNSLCIACRLNRTIPNLSDPDNVRYWGQIESAKRRLVAQLIALGLPVKSRLTENPERGLAFDFLRPTQNGAPVMTGHAQGIITLNVLEADDAQREQIRHALHEPYRTLLGHLRHEVGHYYWERLVAHTGWLDTFRQHFGDERADYQAALQRNYQSGPPADWRNRYISAYASTHPWEDWAETWAHYLHMLDSLGTAMGFGLETEDLDTGDVAPFTREDLMRPEEPGADEFLSLINTWVELMMVLNELARSLGQPDFYPFVMSRPVVAKLHNVHLIVQDVRAGA